MNLFKELIQAVLRVEALLSAILSAMRILVEQQNPPMLSNKPDPGDEWLDAADVKHILKISDSTLYRLRKGNVIRHCKIGSKNYFLASDVRASINKFLK